MAWLIGIGVLLLIGAVIAMYTAESKSEIIKMTPIYAIFIVVLLAVFSLLLIVAGWFEEAGF